MKGGGKYVNPLQLSSDVICHEVLTLKNYVLLTECICGLRMDFETRSDYFPTQYARFVTEIQCLLPGTT